MIKKVSAFTSLVSEENEVSPLIRERNKVLNLIEWLKSKIKEDDILGYDLDFSHKAIRLLKSVMVLYINHFKTQRNIISKKRNLSIYALSTIDEYISECEERVNMGVFQKASPLNLLVEQAIHDENVKEEREECFENDSLAHSVRPRPVILDSMPLFDSELKKRCLDVLQMFRENGEEERFDMVVQEATKILERRLRTLANADDGCSGMELVESALGKDAKLFLSRIPAEQNSWHLFFRGIFGGLRNSTHHRFVPFQNYERTLQILGMVDFLLHILESAEKAKAT